MATIAAKPAVHLPAGVIVTVALVTGLVTGLVIGYVSAPRVESPAGAAAAQIAADNAWVDRFYEAGEGGDKAAIEAMLRPNAKLRSSVGDVWIGSDMIADAYATGLGTEHSRIERTSDVTRMGDILFWAYRWYIDDPGVTGFEDHTWTVRLDAEGRIVTIWDQNQ